MIIQQTQHSIAELYGNGAIKFLHAKGFISSDLLIYFDYYKSFRVFRDRDMTYQQAIDKTAAEHGVSRSTIKRAVRMIQV